MHTAQTCGFPLSRPGNVTIVTVGRLFWQELQMATSALFSFAEYELGIAYFVFLALSPNRVGP
jgi:hypothetical protein